MRGAQGWWWPWAVALVLPACGPKNNHTLMVVIVDSDLRVPDEIDDVEIEVRSAGKTETRIESFALGTLPVVLGIRPDGAPDFSIDVTARGLSKGQTVVVQSAASVPLQAGQAKQFTLFLGRSCAAKDALCPKADETCASGKCVLRTQVADVRDWGGAAGDGGGSGGGRDGATTDGNADGTRADAGIDAVADARPQDVPSIDGSWSVSASPAVSSQATLSSVWPVAGSEEVWVVGSLAALGVAYHFDGKVWLASVVPAMTPPLTGVWAAGMDDIWAVGYSGTIVHLTGGAWRSVASGTNEALTGVWGAAANNVVAVGRKGTIRQWNGNTWSPASSPVTADLLAVSGRSKDDVWTVGTGGTVVRGSGRTWEAQNHGLTQAVLFGVSADSSDGVWAVGMGVSIRFDGASWASFPGTPDIATGVWGARSDAVWAVGTPTPGRGPITRFGGNVWVNDPISVMPNLQAVSGRSSIAGAITTVDVWAVGTEGRIMRFMGRD